MQIGNCKAHLLYGVMQESDLPERQEKLEGRKWKLCGRSVTHIARVRPQRKATNTPGGLGRDIGIFRRSFNGTIVCLKP